MWIMLQDMLILPEYLFLLLISWDGTTNNSFFGLLDCTCIFIIKETEGSLMVNLFFLLCREYVRKYWISNWHCSIVINLYLNDKPQLTTCIGLAITICINHYVVRILEKSKDNRYRLLIYELWRRANYFWEKNLKCPLIGSAKKNI